MFIISNYMKFFVMYHVFKDYVKLRHFATLFRYKNIFIEGIDICQLNGVFLISFNKHIYDVMK